MSMFQLMVLYFTCWGFVGEGVFRHKEEEGLYQDWGDRVFFWFLLPMVGFIFLVLVCFFAILISVGARLL